MPTVLDPLAGTSLETLTLDGLTLNGTDFALAAFDGPPAPKRQRWIEGEDADGAVLVEPSKRGNKVFTATLQVTQQTSMDSALTLIGQIVDKLEEAEQQPDGIPLVWTPADATKTCTFYVLSGEITGLPITIEQGWFAKSPQITLRLDCKPFGYGTEVLNAATVTNSLPYQVLTVANVLGDVRAEARLVVTDAATQSRRHFEWGLQWRYYNAATSLYVDSDNMVTSGFAGAQTTRAGADDPGASGNSVIRATLGLSYAAICGTGNLSHVGTFRVKARVYSQIFTSSSATVRLSWQEGDGPFRANGAVELPTTTTLGWREIDLGLVSIPPATVGTQRWSARIEATSPAVPSSDTLDIDYLLLIPAGEGYGKARAPMGLQLPTTTTARDEFDQAAGNLNAKTLTVGGTWTTSGDATDLVVDATAHTVTRSAVSSTAGRIALAGTTTFTNVVQQFDFTRTVGNTTYQELLARYVDANNYLRVEMGAGRTLEVLKIVAGAGTTLAAVSLPEVPITGYANDWWTIRLLVDASGLYAATAFPKGSAPSDWLLVGSDSVLATGGVLASGKAGFRDYSPTATAVTRSYDNFFAAVPSVDAVAFSGRSAEINSQAAVRQDSTGTYYGPVASYRGARFFLPPAGDESRTSRIIGKLRRNDIDTMPDDQIADSTTVTVHYTPRYSTVPR